MSSPDTTFFSLPRSLQRRIDKPFSHLEHVPGQKGPTTGKQTDSGGGFILPESEPALGGGFVVDDAVIETEGQASQIPLSSIPAALQRLDLPPDDEQVLAVFRNAASGWTSSSNNVERSIGDEAMISRDDWRAVCAVLLEHHEEEYEESDRESIDDVQPDDDGDAESDEYQGLASEGSSKGSEDEYIEGPSTSARRRTRGAPQKKPSSSSSRSVSPSQPKSLTARQKQTCLEAFALFFPSVSSAELPNQKIMIKDIQRVAKVLGEKIKADEMIEMLDAFSTSPDKSMNLTDFGRMMVAAKMA